MNVQSTAAHVHSAEEPIVIQQRIGAVAIVTLNRAQTRNSLSDALLTKLTETFSAIGKDTAIRVVVLAANGPAFCAGHDLKEITARRADPDWGLHFYTELLNSCSALMQTIINLPQAVIAAVQGPASAAGCQLVASCDLAVASSAATFCTPGVDIGLFCSTPMVALSRNVAPKHAMEMLLTGTPISADEALRIGLINRVVEPGREHTVAIDLANHIASKSGHALKVGKAAFYRQREMNLSDAYRYASEVMVQNMLAADSNEGICAFLEKRPPKWPGQG